MPDNRDENRKTQNSSEQIDEIEELNIFIKKKKTQNMALKKIIAKLNTDKNITTDK